MTNGLHARGLTKRFKGGLALDAVDFDALPGQLTGVTGTNGAGKTTLLKIFATILLPDDGTASVNGSDVERDAPAIRRIIGVALVNERAMYWRLNAIENLRFFARTSGLRAKPAAAAADRAAEMFSIGPFSGKPVSALSAGQRQRVNLARALVADPDVLLIDEPFRGLDEEGTAEVIDVLKRAAGNNKTILVAGPTLGDLEGELASLVRLKDGRVITSEPATAGGA